jgi:MYXO-CTERM domain-containing protein
VRFRSQAERLGLSIGQRVERVLLPNPDRPAPEWMFLPALALIGLVALLQWRRRQWDQPGQARAKPA